jgi:uncharacterized membrane protein YccC
VSDAPRPSRLLTSAIVLTLVGLAVSLAHFLWPSPLLFALFMLVGQGSFAAAMALYGAAILKDLKARRVL